MGKKQFYTIQNIITDLQFYGLFDKVLNNEILWSSVLNIIIIYI